MNFPGHFSVFPEFSWILDKIGFSNWATTQKPWPGYWCCKSDRKKKKLKENIQHKTVPPEQRIVNCSDLLVFGFAALFLLFLFLQ